MNVPIRFDHHFLYHFVYGVRTGKEFELMTKDKERILLLEKAKCLQSSHLEEYVKRNQSLQTDLVDREMKLRQALNELQYIQKRVGSAVTATGSSQ